jgi:hypothetical protein
MDALLPARFDPVQHAVFIMVLTHKVKLDIFGVLEKQLLILLILQKGFDNSRRLSLDIQIACTE